MGWQKWRREGMSVVTMIKASISAMEHPLTLLAFIEISGFLLCQRSNILVVNSIISCLPTALE